MSHVKTVLVVVAHADDMEFMAAGTLARLIGEKGYRVYKYILTDNSKGSYRLDREELIAVSAREAVEAGRILGLREVRLEGYPDGELNETPPNELRKKIMAMIREVRADIVMSWDPFAPGEEHPDHRMVSMATLEAASFAGNPMFHPEHAHEPYPPTEAYWFAKRPWNARVFVDITSTIDKKIEALLAHDCQMALTVDSLAQQAHALGLDLPGLEGLEPDGYRALIADGIRKYCEKTGREAGFPYAEQFRYEKLTMLEDILGSTLIETDFPEL